MFRSIRSLADLSSHRTITKNLCYPFYPAIRLQKIAQPRELGDFTVFVLGPKQFEYDNEMFTSLTAVATKITGTHQSGKSFFGVKK